MRKGNVTWVFFTILASLFLVILVLFILFLLKMRNPHTVQNNPVTPVVEVFATAPTSAMTQPQAETNLTQTQNESTEASTQEASTTPQTESQAEATEPLREDLSEQLQDSVDGLSSEWAVYVLDLTDGSTAKAANQSSVDKPMVSASVIKLFVMGALYTQVEAGKLDADSIYSDVYSMITISDNAATNRLTKLLGDGDETKGMELVNAFATSIGCTSSRMERLMLVDNGKQNYVSAIDCATILRRIYNGTCVSAEWSELMLKILTQWYYGDYIPAGVPDGVVVAHKGGDLTHLCQADAGIVFAEGHPYILVIISNHPRDSGAATKKIIELSQKTYEYMTGKTEQAANP